MKQAKTKTANALALRLYVAGNAPNSVRAVANVEAICRDHYQDARLEIFDLSAHAAQALADGIVVTPTLLKLFPKPACRIVGNLSETDQVLMALAAR